MIFKIVTVVSKFLKEGESMHDMREPVWSNLLAFKRISYIS